MVWSGLHLVDQLEKVRRAEYHLRGVVDNDEPSDAEGPMAGQAKVLELQRVGWEGRVYLGQVESLSS